MQYRIKQIELIFEDTESLIIDGRFIVDIGMVAVTDLIHIKSNGVYFDENINCIFFVISEEGNHEYVSKYCKDECSTVFERIIKFRDIIGVHLLLEDGKNGTCGKWSYNVPWDGSCDENLRQRAVLEDGNLVVNIK